MFQIQIKLYIYIINVHVLFNNINYDFMLFESILINRVFRVNRVFNLELCIENMIQHPKQKHKIVVLQMFQYFMVFVLIFFTETSSSSLQIQYKISHFYVNFLTSYLL